MKNQIPKLKTAASLQIHDAANMTPKGRTAIAKWLVQQAIYFLQHSGDYGKAFTSRYLYSTGLRIDRRS